MADRLSWGSNHPGHLVYLLDLSGSMESNGKIDYLLKAIKDTAESLIARCYQGSELKNRFGVSIIGYNSEVRPLFKGSVVDLNNKLDEVYNQGGEDAPLFDKTREAKPQWQTFTAMGFKAVEDDIMEWQRNQQKSNVPMPAPIIIHITDGYPYEGKGSEAESQRKALQAAESIKRISFPDGHPILFNIHIEDGNAPEMMFPSQRPNNIGQQFLYDASSVMPNDLATIGRDAWKLPTQEGCRFMASNVKQTGELVKLITFGSTVTMGGRPQDEQPMPGQS